MRHVGAHLLVHRDEAAFVDRDTGSFRADVAPVGAAADGQQHAVIQLRLGRLLAFEGDFQTAFVRFDLADLGLQVNRFIAFFDALVQRAHQVAIRAGNQAVGQLHHADFAAERVVHRRHFQPDDAAADDQHAPRYIFEF